VVDRAFKKLVTGNAVLDYSYLRTTKENFKYQLDILTWSQVETLDLLLNSGPLKFQNADDTKEYALGETLSEAITTLGAHARNCLLNVLDTIESLRDRLNNFERIKEELKEKAISKHVKGAYPNHENDVRKMWGKVIDDNIADLKNMTYKDLKEVDLDKKYRDYPGFELS
jgi:hypothetical protein